MLQEYKEIKRNSRKHTTQKHFINSNMHKEPPGLLRWIHQLELITETVN